MAARRLDRRRKRGPTLNGATTCRHWESMDSEGCPIGVDRGPCYVKLRREFNSLAKSIEILLSVPIRTSANGRLTAHSDICPLKLRHHHIRQEQ
jgi:hypothetical protein